MASKILRFVVFAVAVCAIGYLGFWPVPIDPVAWSAPVAPVVVPNTRLGAAERLAPGFAPAPEDVAIDAEGRIYGSAADGRIIRLDPDGSNPREFVNTGGRPAGLKFDAAGTLYIADCVKGLLAVGSDGVVRSILTEAGGKPFRMCDDLDISPAGVIYFSDASWKFGIDHYVYDALEHRPNGRLISYDINTKETRVLADDLYFANGVALSPDGSYVLVCETNAYRIRKVWLTGERAGQSEVWVDNLPGFPDGVLSNGNGTYWVALASPRQANIDRLLKYPFVRKVLVRLPSSVLPGPAPFGWVMGFGEDGRVVQDLQDPTGKAYANVTNVVEHDGKLYLGSLTESAIGRIAVP